jgi:hypothetical protein
MGREMLLGGVKVKPSKLVESGFEFYHGTIDKAVESALSDIYLINCNCFRDFVLFFLRLTNYKLIFKEEF